MAGNRKTSLKLIEKISVSIFGILYLLFHSLPAYYTLLKIIFTRVAGLKRKLLLL